MSPFAYLTLKTLPVVFLSAASTTARATDFLVTTDQDEFDGVCDVHCSLRDAIQAGRFAEFREGFHAARRPSGPPGGDIA